MLPPPPPLRQVASDELGDRGLPVLKDSYYTNHESVRSVHLEVWWIDQPTRLIYPPYF